MKNDKEKKSLVIMGLLVAIIIMAVGYAALAQQLTINGTATISSTWDIHFGSGTLSDSGNDDDQYTKPEGYQVDASQPNINVDGKSTTAEFNVNFKSPGDFAEYTFVINNDGTLDGKLTGVDVVATEADGTTSSTLTEALGINYEVTIDGVDWATAKTQQPTLASETTSTVKVKVFWDKNATKTPALTTKKLKAIFTYTQA